MNYLHKGVISIFIIILFTSCNTKQKKYSPPYFEKQIKLKYTIIQNKLLLSPPDEMISFDKYIVVNALTDKKYLHVYDKKTGKYIGGYIKVGQGPEEISTSCSRINYDKKEKIITLLETNTNQYFIYNINKDSENLLTFKSKKCFVNNNLENNERLMGIFKIDKDLYLSDSRRFPPNKNNLRFSLTTETGEIMSEYNNFPTDDFWAYVSQNPRISLSPDRKKMACTTFYGAVLETFTIDDSINLIKERFFYPIILDIKNSIAYPSDETIMGFKDITTSNKYIFSILLGSKDSKAGINSNISVFNWNGDPVIRFKTDIDLYCICYNEDDNFIYAVALTEDCEYILIKFDISDYL